MQTRRIRPDEWGPALARVDGPQLVVAGPGTGKTEFLVRRAVHLISAGIARPGEILVLTFSRRAATELAGRIAAGLEGSVAGVHASTFHSYAHRLLEAHGDGELGTLLTTPEQIRVVGELLAGEDPGRWPVRFRGLLSSPTFAEEVSDFLLRSKERLLGPDDIRRLAQDRPEWRALPSLFEAYAGELERTRRIDYGSLLEEAIRLLGRPQVAARTAKEHRYLLVDEFQDTSPAQSRMLELLSAHHGDITVAGDPYQSIYSFRGAELENLARFPATFGRITGKSPLRVVLTSSFRVPSPIMRSALRVTASGALPGAAGAVEPAPHAGRVESYVFDQQSAEAEWIASEIERLHVEEEIRYPDIAVLLRSKRRFLPELSRALERRRIPHETPDSRLVDHPAVRLVFDLAKAATASLEIAEGRGGPGVEEELDRSIRRLLLGPLVSVPVSVERELIRRRRRTGAPWPAILADHVPGTSDIASLLRDPAWVDDRPAVDGFWHAWDGVAAFEKIVDDPERGDHRAALASFAQALGRQADRDPSLTLVGYLVLSERDDFEATPLLGAHRTSPELLTLTTLHQAKGLEFDVVFIADAVEGVFPDTRRTRSLLQPHLLSPSRTGEPASVVQFRLQEEMRLAYTAMTRARRRVVWTATSAGVDEGERRPSRFLTAAAGVVTVDELGPPPARDIDPVSVLEAETMLRRLVSDPGVPGARRMAAARVLASPPIEVPWTVPGFAGISEPGPDTGLLTPPLRMSPSQAEAYQACPRRYVFERRLRLEDVDSPHVSFGALMHDVLEAAERTAMESGTGHSDLDTAVEALTARTAHHDFGSPILADVWFRKGVEYLRNLYRRWPADSMQPLLLEHELRLELDGVTWIGRVDRIERAGDGGLRVIDYKTSATMMPVAEAAASLQLGFYLLACRSDPDVASLGEPARAELWYPLAGSDRSWRRTFDPANLDTVADRLAAIATGVSAEDWTPRVSASCARCTVRLVCDRWPEGREAFVE